MKTCKKRRDRKDITYYGGERSEPVENIMCIFLKPGIFLSISWVNQ